VCLLWGNTAVQIITQMKWGYELQIKLLTSTEMIKFRNYFREKKKIILLWLPFVCVFVSNKKRLSLIHLCSAAIDDKFSQHWSSVP
jgi:hypothetical protein